MSDDDPSDDDAPGETNWLPDVLQGGLPQIILGKHIATALGRSIAGVTDVPVAALKNVVGRVQDDTDARRRVRKALATAAAQAVKQHPEIVDHFVRKWTKPAREQENREAVAAKVLEKLADDPPLGPTEGPTDDFMNLFETVAERASSENLRDLLARILAGELRKPQSFSLQTLQFASIVDLRLADAMTRASGWITDNFIPMVGLLRVDEKLAILDELADTGLLRSGQFTRQFPRNPEGAVTLSFPYHDLLVIGETPTIVIPAAPLSRKGREVMLLLPPEDDEVVLREIALGLQREVPGVASVRIERRKVPQQLSRGPLIQRKSGRMRNKNNKTL